MANFKTHIATSTVVGVGYGAAAYYGFDVPLPTCLLAGGLCSVSGMLPDLDSGPGVPLRESMAFAAAVVPMMFLEHFKAVGMTNELIVLASAGMYLLIRFGFTELLKKVTVHRGMFHSVPAMLIAGELAFLVATGDTHLRAYKGAAVSLGYLSHLLLDELWSLKWHRGVLRTKSSFGTALKLFGRGWWPNLAVFGQLALISFVVAAQPGVSEAFRREHPSWAEQPSAPPVEKLTHRPAQPPLELR